jgi:hypothetical protein
MINNNPVTISNSNSQEQGQDMEQGQCQWTAQLMYFDENGTLIDDGGAAGGGDNNGAAAGEPGNGQVTLLVSVPHNASAGDTVPMQTTGTSFLGTLVSGIIGMLGIVAGHKLAS